MSIINDLISWLQKIFQWWIIVMPWERGIRVRLGKHTKLLIGGIYFKFPIIDRIYVKTMAKRVLAGPVQTLTTIDGKTLTIVITVAYSIQDIQKLYLNLYHVEMTITNMIQSEISKFVASHRSENCLPKALEDHLNGEIHLTECGIGDLYIAVTGYAIVRTYRIIQDGHYMSEGLDMSEVK